jgi:acetyltransferase-like isoleucine patch superfamily enzyme
MNKPEMNTSFYSEDELKKIPFRKIGHNVMISRHCSIYAPENITLGDHVRIDDFCLLSGIIHIGSYIHISAYSAFYAKFGIVLEDFTTVSARVMIFSQNDDYSGSFMTNPMIPENLRNVSGGVVTLKKFAIVGAGSIILPGVTLQEGAAVGAMSLVSKDIDSWSIFAGIPAVFRKKRNSDIIELSKKIER